MASCYLRRNRLPAAVRPFLQAGYLVGSAARWLIDDSVGVPFDYDVVIPPSEWHTVARLIPFGTPANSFGGFRLTVDHVVMDIWAQDIVHYLTNCDNLAVRPFQGDGFALTLSRPFKKPARRKPHKRRK